MHDASSWFIHVFVVFIRSPVFATAHLSSLHPKTVQDRLSGCLWSTVDVSRPSDEMPAGHCDRRKGYCIAGRSRHVLDPAPLILSRTGATYFYLSPLSESSETIRLSPLAAGTGHWRGSWRASADKLVKHGCQREVDTVLVLWYSWPPDQHMPQCLMRGVKAELRAQCKASRALRQAKIRPCTQLSVAIRRPRIPVG